MKKKVLSVLLAFVMAACLLPVTALASDEPLAPGEHEHIWSSEWDVMDTHHWRHCIVEGCTEETRHEHCEFTYPMKYNDFVHWDECVTCGTKYNESEHVFPPEEAVEELDPNKCMECDYVRSSITVTVPEGEEQNPSTGAAPVSAVGMAAAVLVVAGAACVCCKKRG